MAAQSDLFGFAIILAGYTLCFLLGRGSKDLLLILLLAHTLRTAFALIHHYVAVLPDSQFDALYFQAWALNGATSGISGALQNFTTGAYMYPSLMSFLFLLTGPSELVMQSVNCVLGTVNVYLVYRIASRLFDEKSGIGASIVAAVFPTLVLYSAITMRETVVVFFVLLSFSFLLKWRDGRELRNFAISLVFAFVSMAFHTGMFSLVLMLGGYFALSSIKAYVRLPTSLELVRYVPVASIGVLLVAGVLVTGAGLEKFGGSLADVTIDALALQQEYVSRSRASYLDDLIVTGWDDLIWHAPTRMVYFLFAPFPWAVSSVSDLVGLMDATLYFLLFSIVLANWRKIANRPGGLTFLVTVIGIIYVFSFVTSNYGTGLRHRAKVLPVVVILASSALYSPGNASIGSITRRKLLVDEIE